MTRLISGDGPKHMGHDTNMCHPNMCQKEENILASDPRRELRIQVKLIGCLLLGFWVLPPKKKKRKERGSSRESHPPVIPKIAPPHRIPGAREGSWESSDSMGVF